MKDKLVELSPNSSKWLNQIFSLATFRAQLFKSKDVVSQRDVQISNILYANMLPFFFFFLLLKRMLGALKVLHNFSTKNTTTNTEFSEYGIWELLRHKKIPETHVLATLLTGNAWLFNGKKRSLA